MLRLDRVDEIIGEKAAAEAKAAKEAEKLALEAAKAEDLTAEELAAKAEDLTAEELAAKK